VSHSKLALGVSPSVGPVLFYLFIYLNISDKGHAPRRHLHASKINYNATKAR